MNISYRPAEEKDFKKILKLEKEAESVTYKAFTDINELKKFLEKSVVLIAEDEKNVAGYASMETRTDNTVKMTGLIVSKDYQTIGIAYNLLKELFKQVEIGSKIILETHPKNSKAIRLYLKFGFEIEKWVDNCFSDGEPRLILVKKNNSI